MADTTVSEATEEKIVKPIIAEDQRVREAEAKNKGKVIGEKQAYEKQKQETEKVSPDADYRTDPLFYEVANYFGIQHKEYSAVKQKLSDIVEWAIEVGKSRRSGDILRAISIIERSLRSPGMSERRYANVHRYVMMDDRRQNLEKKMETLRENLDTKT